MVVLPCDESDFPLDRLTMYTPPPTKIAAAAPIHARLTDAEDDDGGGGGDGGCVSGDFDDSPELCFIDNDRRFSGREMCFGSLFVVISSLLKS